MNTVTILSVIVSAVSGAFLMFQAANYLKASSKATKSFKVTNKKTGESTILPVKPTRAEVKRFIDLVEH